MANLAIDVVDARIIDALWERACRCRQLLGEREHFEGLFNTPWPGETPERLVLRLKYLSEQKIVVIDRFIKHWTVAGIKNEGIRLSKKGGRLWRRTFRVDWSRYLEYRFESIKSMDSELAEAFELDVQSTSKSLASEAAKLISSSVQGVMSKTRIKVRRSILWRVSPWKTHRVCYHATQIVMFPRAEQGDERRLPSSWPAEPLMRGWKSEPARSPDDT